MLNPPQVNGLYVDHSSLRFSIEGGSQLYGSHVVSFSYGHKLTPSQAYGTHPIKLPTGLGQYSTEMSMTVVKEAWDDFLSRQPIGYGALVRSASLTYVPRGGLLTTTVNFTETRITDERYSSSQGQGGLTVEVTFDCRIIFINGITLVPVDADTIPISTILV